MKSRWLPRLMFVLGAIPFFWLAWRWRHHQLGINSIETVARYTGDWTIRFLMLTLAITPLRHIPGLQPLARLRRMSGLYTFFYATLHALHYWARDVQWDWRIIQEDLTYRRFFIAGMIAWTLMIPLAATSFDRAIRWMGGRRWRLLHKLIYITATAGVVHYLWQGKTATLDPLGYTLLLAILLASRLVLYWRRKRRSQPKPQPHLIHSK